MDSPTVLCVDDLPQVLELRKAILESHHYCVKTASSGYTAMKILEEAPVAAILLEYKREGMDAEAVAYQIKQRFPKLPIILLSAYSEMPERILWLVDEYVNCRKGWCGPSNGRRSGASSHPFLSKGLSVAGR